MSFRSGTIAAIVLASMALVDGAFAAGTAFTAVLSDDGKTLVYSPCSEDEAAECIAYALDCRGDSSFGEVLRITVMGDPENGPDVRAVARTLLNKPFGGAKVRFHADGSEPHRPMRWERRRNPNPAFRSSAFGSTSSRISKGAR